MTAAENPSPWGILYDTLSDTYLDFTQFVELLVVFQNIGIPTKLNVMGIRNHLDFILVHFS